MLVQATSHNVRAYSLRDAEDFNETSVDYEHLAACASLPSSSLVKERGDLHLRPVMKQRSTREGRAYTAAQRRGQSLSYSAPSASPLPEPPAFQRRTVSTVFNKPCQPLFSVRFRSLPPPLLTAASQPSGLRRSAVSTEFKTPRQPLFSVQFQQLTPPSSNLSASQRRAVSTVVTKLCQPPFSLLRFQALKPGGVAARGGFYRGCGGVSTTIRHKTCRAISDQRSASTSI